MMQLDLLFLRKHKDFFSRNAIIGRTVQVNNFTLGLEKVKRFSMNPFSEICKEKGIHLLFVFKLSISTISIKLFYYFFQAISSC